MHFRRAGLQGLFFQALQFVLTLANVAADGNYFALIIFLQPRNDNGCIEASGVSERNLLGFHIGDSGFGVGDAPIGISRATSIVAPSARGDDSPLDRRRPIVTTR